jgi:Ca2+-dependent lipid-binding protein
MVSNHSILNLRTPNNLHTLNNLHTPNNLRIPRGLNPFTTNLAVTLLNHSNLIFRFTDSNWKVKNRRLVLIGQNIITLVVEARGLTIGDSNGKSDPYVLVKLGKNTHETKVIPKTLNPIWHDTAEL